MSETTQIPVNVTFKPQTILPFWRYLSLQILEWKKGAFPLGAIVYVEDPRYTGFGIVSADSDCKTDLLPVRLENGNVWWYPIEHCQRIETVLNLPRYARRMKLQFHGYKCAMAI